MEFLPRTKISAPFLKQIIVQGLSIFRAIAAIIFIHIALVLELQYFASLLYIAACCSDFIDGYLARLWKQESKGGQVLDLFGDKAITVLSVCFLLLKGYPIIPAALIIAKELFLLSFRGISIDGEPIFKPNKLIGGITVLPIWGLTFFEVSKIGNLISETVKITIFWGAMVIALANLSNQIFLNWAALRKGFCREINH